MSMPPPTPAEMAAAQEALKAASTEIWTYLCIGWLVTGLRSYARSTQVGWRGLQADDYLAWAAAIFYALESGAAYSVGARAQGLANNGLTDAQREALSLTHPEYQLRVDGSKIQIIGWTLYSVQLWCLKASLLFFCLRLATRMAGSSRMRIYVGFGLLVVSWLALFLTIFVQCVPFHKNWQIYPDPGPMCYPSSSPVTLIVSIVMNVGTDLYIMATPLPLLWQSTLKTGKKIGLIALFCGGIFVIACATLRTVLMLKDPINSAQLAGAWSVRETFVATLAANLPGVFPILRVWFGRVSQTVVSTARSLPSKSTKLDGSETTFHASVATQSRKRDVSNTSRDSLEPIVDGYHMNAMEMNSRAMSMGIRKDTEVDVRSDRGYNLSAATEMGRGGTLRY